MATQQYCSADLDLALKEANRLKDYIDSTQYYRYRNRVYDPFRYKPLYTIAEFAWTFTEVPRIAPVTAIYLEQILEDIPVVKGMSKREMVASAKKYLDEYLVEESSKHASYYIRKNRKARSISRLMRVMGQPDFIRIVLKENKSLFNVGKKKMLELYDQNWLPGMQFYQRIFVKND